VLALVALEVPLALSLRDRVDAEVRSQADEQADLVAGTAADLLAPRDRPALQRLSRSAAAAVRGRVIIVDANGTVIADSAGASQVGVSYANRPEVVGALQGRREQRTRSSSTLGEEILATAVPVLRNGRPAGAVRVTQSVSAVRRATRRVIGELAVLGALVLILGLLAGLVVARELTRPVRRLDSAARRLAAGELDVRVPVEGAREQRSLARAFNDMATRLGRMLRSQQDFVADSSHQLRTPLAGLRLRLEEAAAATGERERRHELDAATAEVDRLAAIVEELLLLSRAGERELPGERVALREVAAAAVARWEPRARASGHALGLEPPGDERDAWIARADLDRALDMLVENAVAYTPEDTAVTLAVTAAGLEVRDRGPGIEPGEAERLFERFHRGRAGLRGGPGTGLGLAIARELAREWGGDVRLAPRPGGGAVARIELPLPSLDPVVSDG
jgi:two-component system, OmpR family, sensor kinase